MNRTSLTPDTARDLAARDLDDAMHALGVSNAALAEHLLVDEKLVRDLRKGLKPLTLGRVYQLPARLREDLLRRAAARDARTEIPGDTTPEGQAQVCDGALGEWLCAKARSLADRRWTADEAHRDLPVLRRAITALRALEQRLERVTHGEERPS